MSDSKRLLSVPEAAEMLGLSRHTLNQWVSQGRIPHVKLGRRTLFEPNDLEELIENNRVKPKKYNIH